MFNHILVPLDESVLAEKAIPFALKITNPNGKLTLITAVAAPSLPSPFPVYEQSLRFIERKLARERHKIFEQATEYLSHILALIREHFPASDLLINDGEPATRIIQAAINLGVDAIVMSTHGRSGVSRLVLGSITQKVLSLSPCPVLVVPPQVAAVETEEEFGYVSAIR